MQVAENQQYSNLLGIIPKGYKPNTKEMSDMLGIKPKRIARLLNGTAKKVQLDELHKIANFFKISLKDLIM
jgi:DNA-binding Xre family transcriptional regulator